MRTLDQASRSRNDRDRAGSARACAPSKVWRLAQGMAILLAGLCVIGGKARADTGATDLSFEQLANIEVSGPSKTTERAIDAPAAVTIVTSDEIRAFGFRTLGEVLNVAPGFFSFSDLAYGYVGVNGFAPIGSVNNRVLLLVDGFPTNDNVWEQALLGQEAVIDLDLIDRIEIIRGPGSSVYGANAFVAVINVILKTPAQLSSGGNAQAGSGDQRGGSATYSASAGEDLRYDLHASYEASDGLDVTFPPQPGIPNGAEYAGVDGSNIAHAFAKILDGNLRVNLGFSERRQQVGYGLHGSVQGVAGSWVRDGETFADAHYDGTLSEDTNYTLRASLAQMRYDADINDPGPTPTGILPESVGATGDWIDTEATATHHFSTDDRLIFGVEARRDTRENITQQNTLQGVFEDVDATLNRYGIYAQSDVDWSEHWSTSIGIRDDINDTRSNVNPRLAVMWKPSAEQTVKLLYGSAFRQPSAFERYFAQPPSFLINPYLDPERIHTTELEYEAQLTETTHVALSAFRYHAIDLINQVSLNASGTVVQYQNAAGNQARGFDAAIDQQLMPSLQARLNLSYTSSMDEDDDALQNSPRWTGRLGLEQKLPADNKIGAEMLYVSQRLALDFTPIPGYTVVNATLSNARRRHKIDYSFGVYNLLDRHYAQPLAGFDSVNMPNRTWGATIGYSF